MWILTFESHLRLFMTFPSRLPAGGLCINCTLSSLGWNGCRVWFCDACCWGFFVFVFFFCVSSGSLCVCGGRTQVCRSFRVKGSSVCKLCACVSKNVGSAGFYALTRAAAASPVHDAVSVQGHEVHLAAAS